MGVAYLKDGTRMDYHDYIENAPYWQAVRKARFDFDNHQCVVCHCNLEGQRYETHHLTYIHLGNEHLTDVITLCPKHHTIFHSNWAKQKFWRGKESGHWEVYNMEATAELCMTYCKEDKLLCKDDDAPNLCNIDTIRAYIDQYFKDFNITTNPIIDPGDIQLITRNMRCDLLFNAVDRGLCVEEFLDEYYGPKVRGKNPVRVTAGKYFNSHSIEKFRLHYSENPNINKLMKFIKDKEIKQ